jgi:hypothetical protein
MHINIKRGLATAVVIAGSVLGGLGVASSADATTPPVYEVVTANPATNTWLAVQGPFSKTQADSVLARLQLQKASICRLGLAACAYTYTEYQLVTP